MNDTYIIRFHKECSNAYLRQCLSEIKYCSAMYKFSEGNTTAHLQMHFSSEDHKSHTGIIGGNDHLHETIHFQRCSTSTLAYIRECRLDKVVDND